MHESFYRELQLSNILCLYGVYWDEYVSFNKFHLSNFGDWRIYIGLTVYLPRHSVALAQVYRWRTNIYIITVSQDREWPMKKLIRAGCPRGCQKYQTAGAVRLLSRAHSIILTTTYIPVTYLWAMLGILPAWRGFIVSRSYTTEL